MSGFQQSDQLIRLRNPPSARQDVDTDAGADLRTLMVAYQSGDAAAFDRLYARLAPVIRRRLASLARDSNWVDDLLQETFLQIHRARHTYNEAFPVQPWASAIARHVFLMSHRTRRRRHDFDPVDPLDLEALTTRDHEHSCLAADGVERVLSALTPGARQAVWLHHVVGLSFEEAGQALGIRGSAVKLRVSRAMATMRRHFNRRLAAGGRSRRGGTATSR